MSKISVNLVTWNGAKYIARHFESLKNQTYSDWSLIIIDNGSGDNTVDFVKKELNNISVQYRFIEKKWNSGFAKAHNEALAESDSELVLIINQDTYLPKDFLEKMVVVADKYKEYSAFAPRLMKWEPTSANEFSDTIDSLGLRIMRNRRAVDKYTQKNWHKIKSKVYLSYHVKDNIKEVFGLSGAIAMFRRKALNSVAFSDHTIFDELFFSYKEDVDLAYRMCSAGFRSSVILDCVAYHARSSGASERMHDVAAMSLKRKQPEIARLFSYANHLMLLYKNEFWQNFMLDFPWIFWYELKKFVYFLLFDRKTLKSLSKIWLNKQQLHQKRLEIRNKRAIKWREIRRWIR